MVYCQIAQSNWVTEENLIKGLSKKVWVGFRETQKGQYSNLGQQSSPSLGLKGKRKGMVTKIQRQWLRGEVSLIETIAFGQGM